MNSLNLKNQKRIGEIHTTTDGSKIKIIEYFNFKNVTIKFLNDNTVVKNLQYGHIKDGNVKNKNKLSYFGIGKNGEGPHNSNNQKNIYIMWTNMLTRCYSKEYHKLQPSYIGCIVEEKWHNFQNFAEWVLNNDSYKINYQLDKDILFKENKIYSEETCIFVPREINILLNKIKKAKYVNKNPRNSNTYLCYVTKFGKQHYYGSFKNEEEAILEGKKQKLNYIKEVAILWKDKIHQKVYEKLINIKIEDLL